MKEIWKDIQGFEGKYQISSFGRVKSLARVLMRSNGAEMTIKERIIKTCKNPQGYVHAVLQNGKKTKHMSVHRLVCISFLPNPCNKEQVNHIDGNKENNHISNLEWATRSENERHAHQIGLKYSKGESHSQSKLTESDVFEIRKLKGVYTGLHVANMFNVSMGLIYNIWAGRLWKHV
jgi:hypothetical protein